MARWGRQGLGQRGAYGEQAVMGSGFGYVVWADRDSGKTSKRKLRTDPSVIPWLDETEACKAADERPSTAVLATTYLLVTCHRCYEAPEKKGNCVAAALVTPDGSSFASRTN
jgi:hypothetical protein